LLFGSSRSRIISAKRKNESDKETNYADRSQLGKECADLY
jgi:hypothetical protein